MKHKTAELTGALLDAAVALAEGRNFRVHGDRAYVSSPGGFDTCIADFMPSRSWSSAGPIIERERITIDTHVYDMGPCQCAEWKAAVAMYGMIDIGYSPPASRPKLWHGSTPLIAAMRAFVASKMGDEVEIP